MNQSIEAGERVTTLKSCNRLVKCFGLLLTWFGLAPQLFATEVYNLDFTQPETGSYQTVFGNPTVQESVGSFSNALVFQAVTGYEQIRLPIGMAASQYHIQYDLMVHNLLDSEYAFDVFLDYNLGQNQLQNVYFHGGINRIGTYSPFQSAGGLFGNFANDQVYHMEISLDFHALLWSFEIDGDPIFSSPMDGSNLDAIRFSMAPWIGAAENGPSTYAAIDNVIVTAVPEPSTFAMFAVGGLFVAIARLNKSVRNQWF